jgi:RHS repeat-associated protein
MDCNNPNGNPLPSCWVVGESIYFKKRTLVSNGVYVVTDRLGSVRANTQGESFAYYPFGEERTSTVNGLDKFGTYFRDTVGQDYADQRYYGSGTGRFGSVDSMAGSAANPGSLNRYAYVQGDPVNFIDPRGSIVVYVGGGLTLDCSDDADSIYDGSCTGVDGGGGCGETAGMGFASVPDPACYVPVGPPKPPTLPLKCSFVGAQNLGPTNMATALSGNLQGQTLAGYYMQMQFTFSASGGEAGLGNGTYVWGYAQTVVTAGAITTTTGSYGVHSYTPKDTLASKSAGAGYIIGDAPGLAASNQLYGSILSAHVNWFLDLQVKVTDSLTGVTVYCPTVYWTVSETWATVNGVVQQSGSASVTRVVQQ